MGQRPFGSADKKRFLVFYGPRKKFITLLKIFCHMSLSWATLMYYTFFYSICWISSLILSFSQFISIPSVLSCKFFPYIHVRTFLSDVRVLVSLLCFKYKTLSISHAGTWLSDTTHCIRQDSSAPCGAVPKQTTRIIYRPTLKASWLFLF